MNIATESMKKMTEMVKAIDQKYKEFATDPYGVRKLTLGEQREKYDNLTEAQLYEMVEKHGMDDVNKWMYKMEQGGK